MDLKEILNNFSKTKIVVVGDVMLDNYIYGTVERISPEAPIPIVKVDKEVYELGGAGNVAANITALGGNAFLFGYVGKDQAKNILVDKLNEKGVNFNLFDILEQTIQKIRIIGNQRQVGRYDRENYVDVPINVEEEMIGKISEINPDIIIASDYAKGCLTKNLLLKIKESNPQTKIIIDPKPKNKENYFGAYIITPNLEEAKRISRLENVKDIGSFLQQKYRCNVLITRGMKGMTLFEEDKMINFPTQAKEVYDVSGAGDSVVASFGLSLASGASLEDSTFLANHVAGIVVGKAGTATVSKKELGQVVESEHSKMKTLNELKIIREDYKRKGKKIIWTNGCFDLLHDGHVDYLKKAKKLGDYLFVGLNSDDSVRRLKGKGRPVNLEQSRSIVLSSLEFVDYLVVFNELDVENCLEQLKPDIYVKAGDYDINKMHQGERKVVESYGGIFEFISIVQKTSTTEIINRIKNGE